jgi:dihydrofolate synthase / folylpolyglutamate synthase
VPAVGFEEAQAYLETLGIDAMKSMAPSLHRIEALCDALNHPERAVPAIHVTGTNGKTSTARITDALLSETGLTVGTYTSPHLQTIRERIARAGDPIPAEEFGAIFDHLVPYLRLVEKNLGETLTFFEVLTGMFFLWAAETLDAMVVEVGLGGRWDATNVVRAPVAVITNVGLDHTGLLGTDRETIALEKSGIIKSGASVVTAERSPSVVTVIESEAKRAEADLALIDRDFSVADNRMAFGGRYLSIATGDRRYDELFLPLHGAHQGVNAAVALQAVLSFLPEGSVGDEVVNAGFASCFVPGRLESLHPEGEGAPLLLDVAHNPDGMSALVKSLIEAFAFERAIVVLGILGDKDYRGMLSELARIPCSIIATRAKTVRSVPVDDLRGAAEELGINCDMVEDVDAAVGRAVSMARDNELICVTGSHYVVGEARTYLLGDPDATG